MNGLYIQVEGLLLKLYEWMHTVSAWLFKALVLSALLE